MKIAATKRAIRRPLELRADGLHARGSSGAASSGQAMSVQVGMMRSVPRGPAVHPEQTERLLSASTVNW